MRNINVPSPGIVPSSLSPVLKQEVEVTIDPSFPEAMTENGDDFVVIFVSRDAQDYEKRLRVTAVDVANKKLTAKFGGAISGDYDVIVEHAIYGRIDATAL